MTEKTITVHVHNDVTGEQLDSLLLARLHEETGGACGPFPRRVELRSVLDTPNQAMRVVYATYEY